MAKFIAAEDIISYMSRRNVIIIDLRDLEDYEDLHIRNALHMSYHECVNINVNRFRGKILVLYCDKGNMSLKAAIKLERNGAEVFSVAGGFEAILQAYDFSLYEFYNNMN